MLRRNKYHSPGINPAILRRDHPRADRRAVCQAGATSLSKSSSKRENGREPALISPRGLAMDTNTIFRPYGPDGSKSVRCTNPDCQALNPPEAKLCWICAKPLVSERTLCPIGKRLVQEFEDATREFVSADRNTKDNLIRYSAREAHRERAGERLRNARRVFVDHKADCSECSPIK